MDFASLVEIYSSIKQRPPKKTKLKNKTSTHATRRQLSWTGGPIGAFEYAFKSHVC